MTEGSKYKKQPLVKLPSLVTKLKKQNCQPPEKQIVQERCERISREKIISKYKPSRFSSKSFTNKPFVSYLHRNKSRIRKSKPRDNTGKSK